MPLMKAIQVDAPGGEFRLVTIEIPEPKQNEVLIKVEACGICHGDALVREGHYPGLTYPRIPGHEVVGIIKKLGSPSKYWRLGQRVGVGWHGGHCGQCPACRKGLFNACEQAKTTGLTIDGGYAEYMVAGMEALNMIPDEFSPEYAAPLLCAGRTVFGALKYSSLKGGDFVAIQGFGGLGHLGLQYANKLGCKTAVISRGNDKKELALKLGAQHYFDATKENVAEELSKLGGAKIILCTAPSSKAISELVNGLSANGEIIIVSFSNEPLQISPVALMRGGKSIKGWVGGTPDEAIRFSQINKVMPMIEIFPLEQASLAFEKMMNAKVHFRAVLKIGGG